MRFTILALALLFSAGFAFSQEEKVTFRTLALAKFNFPELWVMESGKPVSIAFSKVQPSLPLKADKSSTLNVFMGPLDETGKPANKTPTSVKLPASSSILLLGWMAGEKPGFLAIDDPYASTMRADEWLVINVTRSEIAIQVGKTVQPIPVSPNSNKSIKVTAPVGKGAATTVAAKQADGTWKSIYNTYLPIFDKTRGLVVVAQNGERIVVNYVVDQITPPEADKAFTP